MRDSTSKERRSQAEAFNKHFKGRFKETESTLLVPGKIGGGFDKEPVLAIKLDGIAWKYFLVTQWECRKFDLMIEPGDIVRISENEDVICPEAVLRLVLAAEKEKQTKGN